MYNGSNAHPLTSCSMDPASIRFVRSPLPPLSKTCCTLDPMHSLERMNTTYVIYYITQRPRPLPPTQPPPPPLSLSHTHTLRTHKHTHLVCINTHTHTSDVHTHTHWEAVSHERSPRANSSSGRQNGAISEHHKYQCYLILLRTTAKHTTLTIIHQPSAPSVLHRCAQRVNCPC